MVVIPVFNEGPVLREVIHFLLKENISNIVIVDDGSTTPVQQLVHDLPVVVLRHKANLGQGAALQTGFDYARQCRPGIVVTFDADGQHYAGDLAALIAPIIENKADIVLGSRFLAHHSTDMSFSRKAVLQLARLINFLLSGVLLSDAHNGLRAMNQKALEKICITENRMAHASEILFEIKRYKLRLQEVPVHIRYTEYSKQKGQSALDSIKVLFDLVLHKLFR